MLNVKVGPASGLPGRSQWIAFGAEGRVARQPPGRNNENNWMTGDPCNATTTWYGLTCASSGDVSDVVELQLGTNGLAGSLPTELGEMTEMTSNMDLGKNSITGSIPTELGGMTGMSSRFSLGSNSLSNAIPTELGGMTGIESYW